MTEKFDAIEWINKKYDITEDNHKENMALDIDLDDSRVTVIIGESGTGKTTLLRKWFNVEDVNFKVDNSKSIFELLYELTGSPEQTSSLLFDVGLSSVPMWKNTFSQISNGEKMRFEFAYKLASDNEVFWIDEWTSMLDRQTAKNVCKKFNQLVEKYNKRVVLVTCHFDILDWIKTDKVVDTTAKKFQAFNQLKLIGRNEWKSEAYTDQCGTCLAVITI